MESVMDQFTVGTFKAFWLHTRCVQLPLNQTHGAPLQLTAMQVRLLSLVVSGERKSQCARGESLVVRCKAIESTRSIVGSHQLICAFLESEILPLEQHFNGSPYDIWYGF